ncbi:ACT domain-containing protein [Clostridium sp. Sa3CVN1]|uniref:ACT domain-containing protein n=1 Tax=Clostridium cibarium TaxID=2762247 RepID=A0ABR8PU34_9CLOT|nr:MULTISPECIES: ACT domain-containing protein [Clostridium]MBD7911685.1 ACT domain-containing protein [Clostridium cibarium]
MNIKVLEENYIVCRLDNEEVVPRWVNSKKFTSITRTEDELSIVCEDKNIPQEIKVERTWRILKIEGPLDFSLIGILSNISSILAEEKISIFAISTFDTDYILVKEEDLEKTINTLIANGHNIININN